MPPKPKTRTPVKGDKPKDAKWWIDIQKKTFTGWMNNVLSKRPNVPQMKDCVEDLRDGIALANVLEILTKEKFNIPTRATSQLVTMDFINKLLIYLRESGVRVTASAEEVFGGNEKMILGLVWSVIKYFQFHSVEEEEKGGSLKQSMLAWLTEELAKYNLPISNFTTSFSDGNVLCALNHEYAPNSVDMTKIGKERLKLAFDVAEKDLSIPTLLDVNDLLEGGDEQSMLTYLSYFRIYSREKKLQNAQELTMDQLKERYATLTRDLQTNNDMLTSVKHRLQVAEDRNAYLEQKYFFTSALGIKMNEQLLGRKIKNFDLAEMWDNIQKDRIPAEQWPRYLSSRVVYAYQDSGEEEPEPEEQPNQQEPANAEQEQKEEKLFEHLGPAIATEMLDGQFGDRQVLGSLISRWGSENGPALTVIRGKSSATVSRLPTINLPWRIVDRITKSMAALLIENITFNDSTAVMPILLSSVNASWTTELVLFVLSCWRVGIAPMMMHIKSDTIARDLSVVSKDCNMVGVLAYGCDKGNADVYKELLTQYDNIMYMCTLCECDGKPVDSFPYILRGADGEAHLTPSISKPCEDKCECGLGFGKCMNKLVYEAIAIAETCMYTPPAHVAVPVDDKAVDPVVTDDQKPEESKPEEEEEEIENILQFLAIPKERADALIEKYVNAEARVSPLTTAMAMLTVTADSTSVSLYTHRALAANSLVLTRTFSMETQDTMLLDAAPFDCSLALASQLAPGLFLGSRLVVVGDGQWSETGLGPMRALREGKPRVWVTRSTHIAHLLSQPGWSPTAEELGSLRVLIACDGASPTFNSSLCSRVLVRAMHNKLFAIAAVDGAGVCGLFAYRLIVHKHEVELWEKAGGVVPGVLEMVVAEPDSDGKGKITISGPQVVARVIECNHGNSLTTSNAVDKTETDIVGVMSILTLEDVKFNALKFVQ